LRLTSEQWHFSYREKSTINDINCIMDLIDKLARKNILELTPYSSAREEYTGEEGIFIDANENPFESGVNRYPDPLQKKLKTKLAQVKKVKVENIFLGNGSDEPIDLLIRVFCEPRIDNIVCIKPSYGMYKVCADINEVEFREVFLTTDFQIDTKNLLAEADENSKLLFLCSPNNPTSNSLIREDICYIIKNFEGIVVLDEAYIDFANEESLLSQLADYPNLVILHTLSKAWGMAGIRMGMAFAKKEIIGLLNRVKYPYNLNTLVQQYALGRLNNVAEKNIWVKQILEQREIMRRKLSDLDIVKGIMPSNANFLMVRFDNAGRVFNYLTGKKIIVRDRSMVPLCEGYLRITIGTDRENETLLKALKEFKP
jgi:histidinol-phosphate aminotransferase